MKIKAILTTIFLSLLFFNFFLLKSLIKTKEKMKYLKKEITSLEITIKDYNDSQKEATRTIVEIERQIENVKEPCGCYNMPIPTDIIDVVRGKKK